MLVNARYVAQRRVHRGQMIILEIILHEYLPISFAIVCLLRRGDERPGSLEHRPELQHGGKQVAQPIGQRRRLAVQVDEY